MTAAKDFIPHCVICQKEYKTTHGVVCHLWLFHNICTCLNPCLSIELCKNKLRNIQRKKITCESCNQELWTKDYAYHKQSKKHMVNYAKKTIENLPDTEGGDLYYIGWIPWEKVADHRANNITNDSIISYF